MHFWVDVRWDEDHRNVFGYEADSEEAAAAAFLDEFHISRDDVISLEVMSEGGTRVAQKENK